MKMIALFGVLLFLCSISAEAVIPVRTCGAVLDVPGGRYKLVRNLECSGPAIVITANNIEFNLSRKTISGPGAGFTPAIRLAEVIGVVVRNGNVNEYGTGVFAHLGSGVQIRELNISDCNNGVFLNGTTNSIVEDNVITSASNSGIGVNPFDTTPADNNQVSGNAIVNSNEGIRSNSNTGTQILNNVITDSVEIGIHLVEAANQTVQGNIISRSGLVGIMLTRSSGNQIANNTSNDNGGDGIQLGNNFGEEPCDDNIVQGNTTNRNADGIFVVIGTGNTFQSNTSLDNTSLDMGDNFLCENTWSSNVFETDTDGDGPGLGCIQ